MQNNKGNNKITITVNPGASISVEGTVRVKKLNGEIVKENLGEILFVYLQKIVDSWKSNIWKHQASSATGPQNHDLLCDSLSTEEVAF